ncbi:MAG: hypothetical protein H6684_11780 [Deltaproteobacteria bacterium]|nr:hypothetical protein [Deltaproteobacteria bacterium]
MLILLVVAVCVSAAPVHAQNPATFLEAGDTLYLKRSDNPVAVRQAVERWTEAAEASDAPAEAFERIARARMFQARFADDEKQRAGYLASAEEAAEKALKADSKRAGGHYWSAAARWESIKRKPAMKVMQSLEDLRGRLEAAKKIDPSYEFAGPDRLLGVIAFQSPVISYPAADEHLAAAVKLAPTYSPNLLARARLEAKLERAAKAEELARRILALTAAPGFEKELSADQNSAKEFLPSTKP